MLHVRFNYWNVRSPLQQFSSHYLVLIIMRWATLAELYGSFSIPTLIWLGSRIYNFQLSIFSSIFFLFERENHPESLSSSSRVAHELKLFSLICKTLWEASHRAICFVSIIAFYNSPVRLPLTTPKNSYDLIFLLHDWIKCRMSRHKFLRALCLEYQKELSWFVLYVIILMHFHYVSISTSSTHLRSSVAVLYRSLGVFAQWFV